MEMKYFEDFKVGEEEVVPSEYLVSKDEIIEMAQRWDPQPFHIDEAAAEASIYGGFVASSVHIFAIYVRLCYESERRAAGLAGLGFDKMSIPNPVRAGDRITAVIHCLEKRESKTKPDRGIVSCEATLSNQRGEVVFIVTNTMMIARRPQ